MPHSNTSQLDLDIIPFTTRAGDLLKDSRGKKISFDLKISMEEVFRASEENLAAYLPEGEKQLLADSNSIHIRLYIIVGTSF
jgi:hypothetical protein